MTAESADDFGGVQLFVTGRICLFGEHSDWAGGYRRFNAEIAEGCALVVGTDQGLYARARKLDTQDGLRLLRFKGPDGTGCELDLDDVAKLREVAKSSSYFAYIAGSLLELGKHFRVGGAEIENYLSDLPIRKGLSSSASICVLVVRALNQLYDLKLTVHGEMDIAYRGEINTPSRCGRLDQCVAFGQAVTKMIFDADLLSTEPVRVGAPIYLVVVDLCAQKSTMEILKGLQKAYPYPRDDVDKALHSLLGEVNLKVCEEVAEVMSRERDPIKAAEALGAAMTKAQARWDEVAVPLCPHELKAPVLHRLLECPALVPHITGGKGIGSQGDGSAQLVCRTAADVDKVMQIVRDLGMEPLRLTINASKPVRTAIIPLAGASPGMWPASKCVGPWLFPVRMGEAVKPAICWLCEELVAAGIERIVMVTSQATEAQLTHLFQQREEVAVLNGVPDRIAAYDQELLAIGKKLIFVRQEKPTGIREAVLLCERVVDDEPFILAWGDHLCTSTAQSGQGCIGQLVSAFDGSRPVVAMHVIESDLVHSAGVFACKEPPMPLPHLTGLRSAQDKAPDVRPTWPLSRLAEKPTREYAEEHLVTPGLPEHTFLSSFGQYVLLPTFFKALRSSGGRHFTEVLDGIRQKDGLNGVLIEGTRWDLGSVQTYIQCLQVQAGNDSESLLKRRRISSS